ncbi:MAG: ATP-binding protein [Asticcacaulis sp.]
MTYLVGFMIATAIESGQQGLLPVAVLLIAAALYAVHLGAVVRKANSALTELANAHQREEAARFEAEAASAAKSAFVATLTHEIRTPMNAVVSARHFLEATTLSADQREHVAMLRDASDVMLGLMNDVLDMAKIEAGRMVIESTPVDLNGLCDSLIRLWTPAARQKGLSLTLEAETPLPGTVLTDPLRLRQILSNLISNAIKFTEVGGVTLRIRPTEGESPKRWLFTVQDSGCGITPDVLNHLFEPFTQASAQTARTHGGTGLGLTISLGLARLMGGDIRVDSAPGEGSSFTVDLPLPEAAASPQNTRTGVTVDQRLTPVGLRVLIAEDHAVNRRILELLLSPLGWHLTLAHDGAEAVAAADLQTFDVILMDMQMPVMDGVSATKALRMGHGPNQATPVIALTANALDSHKALWAEVGVVHFLTKPIDPPALIDTMLSVAHEGPTNRSAVLSKTA